MSEQGNPAESFLGTEEILTKLEDLKTGQELTQGHLESLEASLGVVLEEVMKLNGEYNK